MKLFKGKRIGMIHTMDIEWEHIRAVFFPKNFYEKYRYLGVVPWNEESSLFKAMEPLVIYMDYKAKPKWCPRWFLRFLQLFGNDNSIVRVRNRFLSNLHNKLTKGYTIYDYKTKWEWYDLRISISGDQACQDLADAIEDRYFEIGKRKESAEQVKALDPDTRFNCGNTIDSLSKELERLENEQTR